ncbi:transposase, partial [Burkholderia cepacia]
MLAEILKEASANRDFLELSVGCLVVAFPQQKLGQCSLTLLAGCTCSLILRAHVSRGLIGIHMASIEERAARAAKIASV